MESNTDWIPFIKKDTVETDSMPFAKAEGERTTKTTRMWSINKRLIQDGSLNNLISLVEAIKSLPEN